MGDFYTEGANLSGEGIKRVEHFIFFTREDYAAELRKSTETISRDTNEDEYRGQVREKFIADVKAGNKVKAPEDWADDTPPGITLSTDKKYVTGINRRAFDDFIDVKVKLISRADEKRPNYEKEQATSQSKMADTLEQINNKL
jgi:hypothetical protein